MIEGIALILFGMALEYNILVLIRASKGWALAIGVMHSAGFTITPRGYFDIVAGRMVAVLARDMKEFEREHLGHYFTLLNGVQYNGKVYYLVLKHD